jgi:hypothetical protein
MKIGKRILAGFTFLLGAAGLLLSLAGGFGVWVVKEPVTAKATRVFDRIEAALDVADKGLDHVKTSLARAAERLDDVRAEQRNLAQEPRNSSATRRFMARTVQQLIAPQFSEAHETLHTVAEAAVVVNSVLEDVGNFPFLSVAGLDLDQLREINGRFDEVASSAWQLSRLLGEPGPRAESDEVSPQLSRVDQALKRMRRLVAEYEPRVAQVRQRTEELKARTLPWITPAAVLVSLACCWIALSQVSILFHACSWWGRAGHNPTLRG